MNNYDKLPLQMRKAARWLLWKSVQGDDASKKPRKFPFYADGSARRGELDSPDDIARLASFDTAQRAFETGAYTGLGFALGQDVTGQFWQGIDLDNILEHSELSPILSDLPGYQETSPSQQGMHAIGYGRRFDSLGSNGTGIEAYSHSRYFTVTADCCCNLPLSCLANFVESRLMPMHGSSTVSKINITPLAKNDDVVTPETIEDLRSALKSIDANDRDRWIAMGMALKSLPENAGLALWLEWSTTSPKHDPVSDEKTWKGFDPTRTDYRAVFAEAKRNGWINPHACTSLIDLRAIFSGNVPAFRYKLLSGTDLCNAPPMRWMVRGVLPQEGLAALYGASGSGKSFLILDIAAAVAGGDSEWFGRRVTQAPVTYVCLEGEAGIGKRVKAWGLHHNKAVPDALRFITQPFNLLSIDVAELAQAITTGGGAQGLVILDTLNRAAPGADENSSVDMGNMIAAAKQLQSMTGGLVLLVHHTGKDTTKGLRGHSSLYAALDGAIEVTANDRSRAWSVSKSKDDMTGATHPFKLKIVPVASDDVTGDPITSCVVVSDDNSQMSKPCQRQPKGSNQKAAYEVLCELLPKPPAGAFMAKPKIDYTDAIAAVKARMSIGNDEVKDWKGRAVTAISGLVSSNYIGLQDDQLWIA